MELVTTRSGALGVVPQSANERLKQSWRAWRWRALGVAVAVHAAVFTLWPEVRVEIPAAVRTEAARMVTLASAPAVRPPISEAASAAPAAAAAPDLTLDLELNLDLGTDIPLPVFDEDAIGAPLEVEPLASAEAAWMEYESFAPYMMRPEVRNRTELKRFLERNYQPILEFSGATGVVQVAFWIDEAGAVQRAEIAESSGSRALDRLAMRVSKILRFRPATFAGRPVRVQVRLPITFQAV